MDAQRGIARRMVIGLPRERPTKEWERDFAAYPPAGVILFNRDFDDLEGLRALTSRLRELARPRRLFIAVDEEGGFVSQLAGHLTVPPNAALLARGAECGDIEWASRVTGERLRSLGIDWVFAPVADVHSEPQNPVIGPRAFGTTPQAVSAALAEALAGLSAAGVATCLKHFPGHGDTETDSHLALPVCRAGAATLDQREIAPFRAHLDADSVMSAHVVYPALDARNPATFSRAVVHDLLRTKLGFGGVCVTDALEMKGASGESGLVEAAHRALVAGCDLLLFAFHDESVRRARLELADRLVDGRIDRANFDAARPRLAAFDQRRPEPTAEELARPLMSLTPADWEARLERIIERGVHVRGSSAAPAAPANAAPATRLGEPEWPHGKLLREELAALGVTVNAGAASGIEVIASRVPLPAETLERLRSECAARPTAVVAMQSDAFLDALPGAALRVSACDATPLTRRVVARRLAAWLGARAGNTASA
jgi:beta-glucosidase-like glycosyl hydrolase